MQEYQLHAPGMVLGDHRLSYLAPLRHVSRDLLEKYFSQCFPQVGGLIQTYLGELGRARGETRKYVEIFDCRRKSRTYEGRNSLRDKGGFKYQGPRSREVQ